jgi:archaetidylinositol phosphate synthase
MGNSFRGNLKFGDSVLLRYENIFRDALVRRLPSWLQTYHLTLASLPLSISVIGTGLLARQDLRWLHITSILLIIQYLTDLMDGALGRYRNTGLVKWGYYLDHLFDYVFLFSLMLGYYFFIPPESRVWILVILGGFSGLMISSFLSFAVSTKFQVYYFGLGPTEMRLALVIFNLLIWQLGVGWLVSVLPWVAGLISAIFLIQVIYTQRQLWQLDLSDRDKS